MSFLAGDQRPSFPASTRPLVAAGRHCVLPNKRARNGLDSRLPRFPLTAGRAAVQPFQQKTWGGTAVTQDLAPAHAQPTTGAAGTHLPLRGRRHSGGAATGRSAGPRPIGGRSKPGRGRAHPRPLRTGVHVRTLTRECSVYVLCSMMVLWLIGKYPYFQRRIFKH